jgi:hypothetical protein
MKLMDHIQGEVTFQYYRAGFLYYKTETGMIFPVPISDTGEATFPAKDKGLLYMRYIRQHMDVMKAAEPKE